MKRAKRAVLIIVVLLLVVALGVTAYFVCQYRQIQADRERLQSEEYNAVFFSMYPTDYYDEEDWMVFRTMDIVKTGHVISDGEQLQQYMELAKASGNVMGTIYLGIAPGQIEVEEMTELLQQNPNTIFDIAFAHPPIKEWLKLSDDRYQEQLQNYRSLAEGILQQENVRLHLFSGEEWLICNPLNYEKDGNTNAAVSKFLMANMDEYHEYQLTAENMQERLAAMQSLLDRYRKGTVEYPQGKNVEIVFFGDSIIGNYTDSLSVPEVVQGLSGAAVYNCGYGGRGAALSELTQESFPDIVDALVAKQPEVLPEGTQVYEGVKAFVEREKPRKQLMFVINYGLNDYFNGVPVQSEEEQDITSYSGALHVGIQKLQEAYPQARILIMTPNFTTYFNCGEDRKSEQGGILADYADAVCRVAQERKVDVLDNFRELPITFDNWKVYQDDGCHLNERGRFLLGKRIADKLMTQ
ncbi:MAG: SGNH/GDSL hydrolase family protein [Lachnospiraceae bacterium]|nr:SGNH/GDSL hydrolase family protein [Lachnospiraceae bacterium]